jgi:hypothetical protein
VLARDLTALASERREGFVLDDCVEPADDPLAAGMGADELQPSEPG